MSRAGRVEVYRDGRRDWRWTQHAPNGAIISAGTEGYRRLRDLAHNLEQAFPGYRLLDQDCGLQGPSWFLHGMQFAYPNCAAEIAIPEDSVMGVGMRGVRIPVSVPVGVWLGSRYRR